MGKKLPVRQVSDPRRGVCHIVVLSWDASYGGRESSHRIGPMEEAVLTLPLLAHPCASVLLTYVWMCAKTTILGANIRSCMSSNPSSRLFIVTSQVGLE